MNWISLTMDFDFLRYLELQGTHMVALKPSGIFWTKFVDLAHSASADTYGAAGQSYLILIADNPPQNLDSIAEGTQI